MPLQFQPSAGTILQCDFRGFVAPEMVKPRQVVVLAKHKRAAKLVYVLPLSTTPPHAPELAHQLERIPILRPGQDPNTPIWVKCDMVYTLSTDRLQMPVNRSRRGSTPININISVPDLVVIRGIVARAMRLT